MAYQIPQDFAGGGRNRSSQDYMDQAVAQFGSFIKTPEQKYQNSVDLELSASLGFLEDAYAMPFDKWSTGIDTVDPVTGIITKGKPVDFTQIDNAGKAYLDWKTDLEAKGGRGWKYAKKNKLLNPIAFKTAYNKQITAMVPEIAQSMMTHQQMTGASNSTMKGLIDSNPGLKKLLIETGYGQEMFGEEFNPIYPWLVDQPGFFGQIGSKMYEHPYLTGAAAYGLYRGGKAYGPAALQYMKGKMPTGWWPGGGGPTGGTPTATGIPGKQLNLFGNKTASNSQVKNVINKLGGKNKVTKMLSSQIGKKGALKAMGTLLSRANVPLTLLSMLWMIASQDKDKYSQAQQANLNQVLNASKINITGIK